MAKIIHKWNGEHIEKETRTDNFILTNNKGGYVSLSERPVSRYQGVFFKKGDKIYKTISNINLSTPVDTVINHMNYVERKHGRVDSKIWMPSRHDALLCGFSEPSDVKITLDCRKQDDTREFGRYYSIEKKSDHVLVTYKKMTDAKEDQSHGEVDYEVHVAMLPDNLKFRELKTWVNEKYPFDAKRNSPPTERHVYEIIEFIGCKHISFGFSTDKKEALRQAKKARDQQSAIEDTYYRTFSPRKSKDKEEQFAEICAENGLASLFASDHENEELTENIFAGFYWFHQYWSRDTLISLKALMMQGHLSTAKKILFTYLNHIVDDGRLHNRVPTSELPSADAIGWLFKRVDDLLMILDEKRLTKKMLHKGELLFIKHQLEQSIYAINETHSDNGLIVNEPLATWMDTEHGGDRRGDARIEIQALHLAMCKLFGKLCKITKDRSGIKIAKRHETRLKDETRKVFWNGDYLHDGRRDAVIRPNVFIAYYVYPELLSEKEWKRCFDKIIPALWLPWGGLASIDKDHKLFHDVYDGPSNKAYHRGTSWFWVNNLAAMCMQRLDAARYKKHINIIKNASIYETLWSGAVGHHAEISSAKELHSSGCLTQAWSNALLYELLREKH